MTSPMACLRLSGANILTADAPNQKVGPPLLRSSRHAVWRRRRVPRLEWRDRISRSRPSSARARTTTRPSRRRSTSTVRATARTSTAVTVTDREDDRYGVRDDGLRRRGPGRERHLVCRMDLQLRYGELRVDRHVLQLAAAALLDEPARRNGTYGQATLRVRSHLLLLGAGRACPRAGAWRAVAEEGRRRAEGGERGRRDAAAS